MDYVVSDLHLGHGNIIEYCDRPFESVEEMNERLVSNWNSVVDDGDDVLFGGDLTVPWSSKSFDHWVNRLNGELTFLLGNHDDPETVTSVDGIEVSRSLRFQRDGYDFYADHFPENASSDFEGWVIHGHHHNNYPDEYPFVNPDGRRVNVSCELTGYRPLSIDTIIDGIETGAWLQTVADLDAGPADDSLHCE